MSPGADIFSIVVYGDLNVSSPMGKLVGNASLGLHDNVYPWFLSLYFTGYVFGNTSNPKFTTNVTLYKNRTEYMLTSLDTYKLIYIGKPPSIADIQADWVDENEDIPLSVEYWYTSSIGETVYRKYERGTEEEKDKITININAKTSGLGTQMSFKNPNTSYYLYALTDSRISDTTITTESMTKAVFDVLPTYTRTICTANNTCVTDTHTDHYKMFNPGHPGVIKHSNTFADDVMMLFDQSVYSLGLIHIQMLASVGGGLPSPISSISAVSHAQIVPPELAEFIIENYPTIWSVIWFATHTQPITDPYLILDAEYLGATGAPGGGLSLDGTLGYGGCTDVDLFIGCDKFYDVSDTGYYFCGP